MFSRVTFTQLPVSGTIFLLRKLCPEAYNLMLRLGRAVTDEVDTGSTMVKNPTARETSVWKQTITSLTAHQTSMALLQNVNCLLGLWNLTWDDYEYTLCEVRSFVYKPRPRKSGGRGWSGEVVDVHREWYRKRCLPWVWQVVRAKRVRVD